MQVLRAAVAAAMVMGLAVASVSAHEPTCADVGFLEIEVHGQHVVRDYVIGDHGTLGAWPPGGSVGSQIAGRGADKPGGPGPTFHFANGIPPGASFCIPQARSDRALR